MRSRYSAFVIAVILMLAAVQPALGIVYGSLDGNDHPNVGAMVVDDGNDIIPVCSGTLVKDGDGSADSGTFLTAAHCLAILDEYGGPLVGVVKITFASTIGAPFITVTDSAVHPRYNLGRGNPFDVAVLTFADQTGKSPAQIAPVGYLDGMSRRQLRRARFTTVGYGVVRSIKQGAHQVLDWDNVDRRNATQGYQSRNKAWLALAMNQRSVPNGGSCYGDSGGPHFLNGKIASITVTGDTFCKATDKTYRLDRSWVHQFLDTYLP